MRAATCWIQWCLAMPRGRLSRGTPLPCSCACSSFCASCCCLLAAVTCCVLAALTFCAVCRGNSRCICHELSSFGLQGFLNWSYRTACQPWLCRAAKKRNLQAAWFKYGRNTCTDFCAKMPNVLEISGIMKGEISAATLVRCSRIKPPANTLFPKIKSLGIQICFTASLCYASVRALGMAMTSHTVIWLTIFNWF